MLSTANSSKYIQAHEKLQTNVKSKSDAMMSHMIYSFPFLGRFQLALPYAKDPGTAPEFRVAGAIGN